MRLPTLFIRSPDDGSNDPLAFDRPDFKPVMSSVSKVVATHQDLLTVVVQRNRRQVLAREGHLRRHTASL